MAPRMTNTDRPATSATRRNVLSAAAPRPPVVRASPEFGVATATGLLLLRRDLAELVDGLLRELGRQGGVAHTLRQSLTVGQDEVEPSLQSRRRRAVGLLLVDDDPRRRRDRIGRVAAGVDGVVGQVRVDGRPIERGAGGV